MIALVVRHVGQLGALREQLGTLGGRHEVYGVSAEDYFTFTAVLVDSLRAVLGPADFPPAAASAWQRLLGSVAAVMQESARRIRAEGYRALVVARLRETSEWKKTALVLTLDVLFLYRDDKFAKLRTSVDLAHVVDLEPRNFLEPHPPALPYTLAVKVLHPKPQTLLFACATEHEREMLRHELRWRSEAALRIAKDEPGTNSDDDASTSASASASASTSSASVRACNASCVSLLRSCLRQFAGKLFKKLKRNKGIGLPSSPEASSRGYSDSSEGELHGSLSMRSPTAPGDGSSSTSLSTSEGGKSSRTISLPKV